MTTEMLITGAVLYVGTITAALLVMFLILEVGGRVLREADDQQVARAMLRGGIAGLLDCGFTDRQIARLVHYRDAVQAGFFTDEIPGSVLAGTPRFRPEPRGMAHTGTYDDR